MENKHIKLGDLINLVGLEKPPEGTLKVAFCGKPEKTKNLGEKMTGFAGKVEDQKDVGVGEVSGLVAALKGAIAKELSPENEAKLLVILKKRFLKKKKAYKSAEGIRWEDVEKKLQDSPEKMWSLQQMEDTGGEPDVLEQDGKTGEYVFMDCSAESPAGRRDCVYDREGEVELRKVNSSANYKSNAESMSVFMGVDMLNEKDYRELQTKGEFDKYTWSWIKTPVDKRNAGGTLFGDRVLGDVRVGEGQEPGEHNDSGGFRSSLRV